MVSYVYLVSITHLKHPSILEHTYEPDHDPIYHADCPSRAILDQIADKWSMLVLMVLHEPRRFNAIKRRLDGITQRVLTQTLAS